MERDFHKEVQLEIRACWDSSSLKDFWRLSPETSSPDIGFWFSVFHHEANAASATISR